MMLFYKLHAVVQHIDAGSPIQELEQNTWKLVVVDLELECKSDLDGGFEHFWVSS